LSLTELIDLLQWPAMVVTIVGAWLVASRSRKKRVVGFWVFLASNILWSIWGWYTRAYALIILQVFLAFMSAASTRTIRSSRSRRVRNRGRARSQPRLCRMTGSGPARKTRPRLPVGRDPTDEPR